MNEKQIRNLGIATVIGTGIAYTASKFADIIGFGKNPSKVRQAIFIGSLITLIGYKSCDTEIKETKDAVVQVVDNKYKKERDAYKESLYDAQNKLAEKNREVVGLEKKIESHEQSVPIRSRTAYEATNRGPVSVDMQKVDEYSSFQLVNEGGVIHLFAERYIKGQAKYMLLGEFANMGAMYDAFPTLSPENSSNDIRLRGFEERNHLYKDGGYFKMRDDPITGLPKRTYDVFERLVDYVVGVPSMLSK